MKKSLVFFSLLSLLSAGAVAADFKLGTTPLVDGVYQSTQVVVDNHQPVFSWEYTGTVSSFTITVSADAVFAGAGELWNYTGSTTTVNTINRITRVAYDADGAGAALVAGRVYYWQAALYDGGSIAVCPAQRFTAIGGTVLLAGDKLDLAVDWNNPFDPSLHQTTRFTFVSKGRDRMVQLRVFTVSGELVRQWPEQTALQDAWYTQEWDGKNTDGDTVARGIYLVNLKDFSETRGVTRRLAVIKKQ